MTKPSSASSVDMTKPSSASSVDMTKPSSAPEDLVFYPDMFSDDGGLVEAMPHVPR